MAEEKPFGSAEITFLVILAAISDIADLLTDLLFPVPILGQIIYILNAFLFSPLVWATIQIWFIMKIGFGAPGLINVAGGIGNVIGIPGSQTLAVIIALYLANNPTAREIATKISPQGTAGKIAGEAAATSSAAGKMAAAEGKIKEVA